MNREDRIYITLKQHLKKLGDVVEKASKASTETAKVWLDSGSRWAKSKGPGVSQSLGDLREATAEFLGETYDSGKDAARGMYDRVRYTREKLQSLENLIRYQGGYYRELNRNSQKTDSLMVGGESMAPSWCFFDLNDENPLKTAQNQWKSSFSPG